MIIIIYNFFLSKLLTIYDYKNSTIKNHYEYMLICYKDRRKRFIYGPCFIYLCMYVCACIELYIRKWNSVLVYKFWQLCLLVDVYNPTAQIHKHSEAISVLSSSHSHGQCPPGNAVGEPTR